MTIYSFLSTVTFELFILCTFMKNTLFRYLSVFVIIISVSLFSGCNLPLGIADKAALSFDPVISQADRVVPVPALKKISPDSIFPPEQWFAYTNGKMGFSIQFPLGGLIKTTSDEKVEIQVRARECAFFSPCLAAYGGSMIFEMVDTKPNSIAGAARNESFILAGKTGERFVTPSDVADSYIVYLPYRGKYLKIDYFDMGTFDVMLNSMQFTDQ